MNIKRLFLLFAVMLTTSLVAEPGFIRAEFSHPGASFDINSDILTAKNKTIVEKIEDIYVNKEDRSMPECTTYAYFAYMWIEGGKLYNFKGQFDDHIIIKIDDKIFSHSANSYCEEIDASISFDESKWHKIELRFSNYGSVGGSSVDYPHGGLWFKVGNGSYQKFEDDGDGKLFRTDEPEGYESGFSGAKIINIKVQQRYPWNGKVDIDYEVVCDDANADVWVYATGYDNDSNSSMAVRAVSGDGANAPVKAGKHRMTWDVTADYPGFNSTSFKVKMTALTGGAPYMVIDLSGGVDAQSYPVSYLSSIPAGGWTDEYKTTKLVLRLIPPGTFMMGSPSDELGHDRSGSNYETLHQVTLTKPFYIGIFELTQKQFSLVMGSNPSLYTGDVRPVEQVSYDIIRGTVNGSAWPSHNQVDANSFMGRLRSKVNMLFDLPTEAQWEYACRAGTSTALNSGKNLTGTETCANMAEVGRYGNNRDDGKGGGYSAHTKVGMYRENAWGLYDMHGNVAEWCLDWWVANLGTSAQIDPKGASSGSYRLVRGGCLYGQSSAVYCRSAYRGYYYNSSTHTTPGNYRYGWGFRVCCLPAE